MRVQLDRRSPSENGIVTAVVTASSLLESLEATFDFCSCLKGSTWNERRFKGSVLVASTLGIVEERVIQTAWIASCSRALCISRLCVRLLLASWSVSKISGVPFPSAETSEQCRNMPSISLNICSADTVSVNNIFWDWSKNCSQVNSGFKICDLLVCANLSVI